MVYKKIASYLIVIFFAFLLVIIIVLCSIKTNVFSNIINPNLKNITNLIMPESFGFFTKDPKDKQMVLYKIKSDSILKINLKNNSTYNYFGLSRKSRRLIFELGGVFRRIPDSLWLPIRSDSLKYINTKSSPFQINDSNKVRLLNKGKYILFYTPPIPWEWNEYKKTTNGEFSFFEIK